MKGRHTARTLGLTRQFHIYNLDRDQDHHLLVAGSHSETTITLTETNEDLIGCLWGEINMVENAHFPQHNVLEVHRSLSPPLGLVVRGVGITFARDHQSGEVEEAVTAITQRSSR
jgi:hypothetical protein